MKQVVAAKMMSTISHISNGRVILNIVAGWNVSEFNVRFTITLQEVCADGNDRLWGMLINARSMYNRLTRICSLDLPASHEERYDYALEYGPFHWCWRVKLISHRWTNIIKALWKKTERFDYDGKYWNLKNVLSEVS